MDHRRWGNRVLLRGRRHRGQFALSGALALVAVSGIARAQAIELQDVALGTGGFATSSNGAGDQVGRSVSWAGDVNGDTIDDFIVGAPYADVPASNAGRAYVVFGRSGSNPAYLTAVANGTGGFVINGAAANEQAGTIVRGAGDVNGDGYNDLLVGAPKSDPAAGNNAGRVYLVFGKATTTAVNLSALGTGGVEIVGTGVEAYAGMSLDGAGDVNGDGFADIVVGQTDSFNLTSTSDRWHVIFGGTGQPASLNLSSVGATVPGFIVGEAVHTLRLGWVVAGAGDFNGDGLSDIVLGVPTRAVPSSDSGGAFVVFGKSTQGFVDITSLEAGVGGLLVANFQSGSQGRAVSSAGDVNGDGFVDILVASEVDTNYSGDTAAGRIYVIHGRTSTTSISLSNVLNGTGGFVIEGFNNVPPEAAQRAGASVAPAGDVNGDGFADVIVGSPKADRGASIEVGRAYVVFGKTSGTAVKLNDVTNGVGGFLMHGVFQGDEAGSSVAGLGDVDGDGLSDVLVGSPLANAVSANDAGQVYVVHSPTLIPTANLSYRVRVAPGNTPNMLVGGGAWASNGRTFNPARVSLNFAQGTGPSGGASQLVVNIFRGDQNIVNLGSPAQIADLQLTVSNVDRSSAGTPTWTFRYTDAEVAGLHKPSLKLYRSTTGNTGPWVEMPATNAWWRNEFTAALGNFGHFAIADLDAPTVSITTLDANPHAGHLPRYGITFSEPIGDSFTIDDLYIGTSGGFGSFPQLLSLSGTDPNYIVQVMVPSPIVSGTAFTMFLEAGSVTDLAGNPLGAQVQAPWYVLYPPPAAQGPGDINKDGAVNVADVTALADHIVNGTPLP